MDDNIVKNKRRKQHEKDDDTSFDEELYKRRYVIERANAWTDQL